MRVLASAVMVLVELGTAQAAGFGDVKESELTAARSAWIDCTASEMGKRVGGSLRKTGETGDFEATYAAAADACDSKVQAMKAVKDKAGKEEGGDRFFQTWSGMIWADTRERALKAFQNTTLECVKARNCR